MHVYAERLMCTHIHTQTHTHICNSNFIKKILFANLLLEYYFIYMPRTHTHAYIHTAPASWIAGVRNVTTTSALLCVFTRLLWLVHWLHCCVQYIHLVHPRYLPANTVCLSFRRCWMELFASEFSFAYA